MRNLDSHKQGQDPFPPYQEEKTVGRLKASAASGKHLALCLEGRFEEARAKAGSGRLLEEVGETLAILAEFEAAQSIACDSTLEAFRQESIRFVLVIET